MNMQDKNKQKKEDYSVIHNEWIDLDSNYLDGDIERWLRSVKIRCKKSTYSNYQYVVQARIIPKFAKVEKRLISADLVLPRQSRHLGRKHFLQEKRQNSLLSARKRDWIIQLGTE